jgi:hypothetical protein
VRGCLVTIALLLAIALAATWYVLPPLAGTLTQGALSAAGFEADTTTVTVTADPPPKLLTLTADSVRIQATNVTYHGMRATSADVTLAEVSFAARTFQSLDGTLKGVRIQLGGGSELGVPLVRLSGPADRIQATMSIPAADAEALAGAAVETVIGITPERVSLVGPDRVRVEVGGLAVSARLALRQDGALMLVAPNGNPIGSVALVVPGPDVPFRIDSFEIVDGGLEIVAVLANPG